MEDHSIDYYQELLFSIGEELSNLPSSLPTPSPSSSTGSSAQHPRVQRAKTTLPAPFPRYAWECSRDEPPGGSFGSSPGRMSTRSRTRFKSPLTPMSSRTIDSPISTPSVDIADGSTASIHSQKGVIETPLEFRDELKVQVPDLVDDKAHLDSPATASTSAAHDENVSLSNSTHSTQRDRNESAEISPASTSSAETQQMMRLECLSDAPDDTDIINCLTDFELEREQRGSRLTDCVIPLVLADDTITSLKIVDLTEENNPVRRCLRMNRQKANVLEHARQTAEEELADICKQTKANDEEQAEAFPSHFVRVARNVLRRTFRRNAEEKRMFGRSLVSTKLASKFNSELPLFVHYIMSILLYAAEKCQIHGLFRTAAVASEALECREQCNRLGVNDPLPEAYCREAAIPVLADVFKKFLREIPNKLISSHVCSMMSACMSLEDYESRLHALRCCVLLMDKCQRNALFSVVVFVGRIAKCEKKTLMNLDALITVFMPNICNFELATAGKGSERPTLNHKQLSSALSFLVENAFEVMSMPPAILEEATELTLANLSNFTNHFMDDARYNFNTHTLQTLHDGNDELNQLEYRAEATIEAHAVDILIALVDDRSWDPAFQQYDVLKDDDMRAFIQCKTRRAHPDSPPFLMTRYVDYIRLPEFQSPIYALFERIYSSKESDLVVAKMTFFFIPFKNNLYNTVVLLLSTINNEHSDSLAYDAEDSLRTLRALQNRVKKQYAY